MTTTTLNTPSTRVIYRSDNEIKRLKEEEAKKQRIQRLVQVREMAKEISKTKTKEYNKIKEQEERNKVSQVKLAWQGRKHDELEALNEELERARSKIGEAHRNAQIFSQDLAQKAKQKQLAMKSNTEKAQTRFEQSMNTIREKKDEAAKYQQEKENRTEKAKNLNYPKVELQHEGFEKLFAISHSGLNNVIAGFNPIQKREEAPDPYKRSFHHMHSHHTDIKEQQVSSVQVSKYVTKHVETTEKDKDFNNERAEKEREEKRVKAIQNAIREKEFTRRASERIQKEKFKDRVESELGVIEKMERRQRLQNLSNPSRTSMADQLFKKRKQADLERKFEDLFVNRMPDCQEGSSYF